ncbi:MAG: hypothetical protein CME65_10245 [Halobacteriovoraceae bacterium]|nr:hypothetical protein [Halobacteriovoraceae bacterium]
MGSSYSDIGNILSYTVDTIKDGEVIATQNLDPLVSGTYFTQSFHMEGIYQVKLTVIDESGDTDSTFSREYEIIYPAPIVELAVTQNEEYKDIFEFDLTGTKMESGAIDYIYLYFARSLEETGGAYEELDFKFISGQDFRDSQDLKFNYKTTARGNVFVGAFVVSTDGVSNFYDIYGLNIPDSPKESIFLNLSHSFKRENEPYTQVYAFPEPIAESEFKQFIIKVTDSENNTVISYQDYPNLASGYFHVDVNTEKPGAFDVEVTLETNEGLLSLPFKSTLSFNEVDLGEATLSMNLYFTPEDESRSHVNWDVDVENSSPGNFGYFTNFYCDFEDQQDSENSFRIEKEWTQYYWIEIPRGNYEVLCFGETNIGLISSNELRFQIDARNRAPIISNVDYYLVDPAWQEYEVYIEHSDDMYVNEVLVKETHSNGITYEYTTYDYLTIGAIDFEFGDGVVNFEIVAFDNEGQASEPYTFSIEFNNEPPEFEILSNLLDENTKEYQFNFQMSDDGYVERQIFTAIAPTGNVYSYDAFNVVEQFLNEAPGIWTIQVEGIDNFGKSTVKSTQVEVENKAPEVLALNVFPVNENERLFEIVPDVVDYDGYFIADELIITFPSGSTIVGNPGTGPSHWNLNEPGNYVISYRAQDNAGDWSEVFTTNYSVENKAPVAVFEITQVSQDRWFVVTESSYDEDGFIIEHRFEFTGPQGESITRFESGSFDIQLASPGIWNVGYDVKDNDQEWSARVESTIEIESIVPVVELTVTELDEQRREYTLDLNILEGSEENLVHVLNVTTPSGSTSSINLQFPYFLKLTSPGTWNLEVVSTNSDNEFGVSSASIEAQNSPPSLAFQVTPEQNILQYQVVEFLNKSFDQNGDPMITTWQFPNGELIEGERVLHFFDEIGTKEILMTVTDMFGMSSTESIFLEVYPNLNDRPESKIMISGDFNDLGEYSEEITFYSELINQGNGGPFEYYWDFGNGDSLDGDEISYVFEEKGAYDVTLTTVDKFGISSTTTETINIERGGLLPTENSEYEILTNLNDGDFFIPLDYELTIESSTIFSEIQREVIINDILFDNFRQVNDSKLSLPVKFEEGVNIVELRFRDENNFIMTKAFAINAGSQSKIVQIKDSHGSVVRNLPLDFYLEGEVFEVFTDGNGLVSLPNIQDSSNIILSSSDQNCLTSFTGKINQIPNSIVCEDYQISNNSDLGVNSNLDGWVVDYRHATYFEDSGEGVIKLAVPQDDSSEVVRVFEYRGEEGFLSTTADVGVISPSHTIDVSIRNLTSGEQEVKFLDREGASRPQVYFEDGDLVYLSVGIKISQNRDTVFNYLLNRTSQFLVPTANALESTLLTIEPLVRSDFKIDLKLLDLNYASQYKFESSSLKLSALEKLSVGDYGVRSSSDSLQNIKNKLYGSIRIVSKKTEVILNLTSLQVNQLGVPVKSIPANFGRSRYCKFSLNGNGIELAETTLSSDMVEIKDGNIEDWTLKCSEEPDNLELITLVKLNNLENRKVSSFLPFYEIPKNSGLNARSDVNLFFGVQVENQSFFERVVFSEDQLLVKGSHFIQMSAPDGNVDDKPSESERDIRFFSNGNKYHYNSPNLELNSPNNGDYWVTKTVDDIIQFWIEQSGDNITFKIGDTSNINGNKRGSDFFQPHGSHNDGQVLDVITPNFHGGDLGFDIASISDLRNLINPLAGFRRENGDEIKPQVGVTRESSLEALYRSTCLGGRSVSNQITPGRFKGHKNHFHFNFGRKTNFTFQESIDVGYTESVTFENDQYIYRMNIIKNNGNRNDVYIFDKTGNLAFSTVTIPKHFQTTTPSGLEISLIETEDSLTIQFEFSKHDLKRLYYISEEFRLMVNQRVDTTQISEDSCGAIEIELKQIIEKAAQLKLDDCNLDGIADDPAVLNDRLGIVSENLILEGKIVNNFWVQNGARVCGESTEIKGAGTLNGRDLILEDTLVGDKCLFVTFDGSRDFVESKRTRIKNSEICTETVEGVTNDFYQTTRAFESEVSSGNYDIINSKIDGKVVLSETSLKNTLVSSRNMTLESSDLGKSSGSGFSTILSGGRGRMVGSIFESGEWRLPYDYWNLLGGYVFTEAIIERSFIRNSNFTGFFTLEYGEVIDSTIDGRFYYFNSLGNTEIGRGLIRILRVFGGTAYPLRVHRSEVHGNLLINNSEIYDSKIFGKSDIIYTSEITGFPIEYYNFLNVGQEDDFCYVFAGISYSGSLCDQQVRYDPDVSGPLRTSLELYYENPSLPQGDYFFDQTGSHPIDIINDRGGQ